MVGPKETVLALGRLEIVTIQRILNCIFGLYAPFEIDNDVADPNLSAYPVDQNGDDKGNGSNESVLLRTK
jgi:hypothetical protein